MSQFNTYTGCTAGGEGGGIILFKGDNFINTALGFNYEGVYEGCIFDNSEFQMSMQAPSVFSTVTAYNVPDVILPTSLNGFYYVCIAAPVTPVAQPQPTWTLTEGTDVVSNGYTWRAFTYDPIYTPSIFKDCKFNHNKPDKLYAWLHRRGAAEFTNCKFDVVASNGFFSDDSLGWDDVGNSTWSFKDCEIVSPSSLGNLRGKRITLERTRFNGPVGYSYTTCRIYCR